MKKKILILDDKETIAKVLSIYLMSDYDVQWLPDGLQGVKWLQASLVWIILPISSLAIA